MLLRLAALMLLILFVLTGCGGSDDPAGPTTGTITINPEPNSINAPWQMTGPSGFNQSGNGDDTLEGMAAGAYTLTWGAVSGWTLPSPASSTQSLVANETLTFAGTFVVQAGTITIDPEPNSINAPWQIEGPGGFSQAGVGDISLASMAVGSYTLTWGNVGGWTTPNPFISTQVLSSSGTVTFSGTYFVESEAPEGFVSVHAGTFDMGSPTDEPGRSDEEVLHQVTLTHGIFVQATEVTNQQYVELAQWAYDNGYVTAPYNYSYEPPRVLSILDNLDGSTLELVDIGTMESGSEIDFSDGVFTCSNPDHPVIEVTWYGAAAYCDWLSLRNGLPRAYDHATWQCNEGSPYVASGYRLPTEAEWEYSCRAQSTTAFSSGAITVPIGCSPLDTNLDLIGWYCGNTSGAGEYWSHPVAQKAPNGWGLYDMHGNAHEWCNDIYAEAYGGDAVNPVGPTWGSHRVIRGGDWMNYARFARSARRDDDTPSYSSHAFGFRPVRTAN